MKEQTFRSPGFFEREIDLSSREAVIEGVPAGIIGTATRGPAFVPVTVGSFSDFEFKFGSLDPDRFGPYAVDAFLQHKTALTYIRVLGAGANRTQTDISATDIKGTVKSAGFVIKGAAPTPAEAGRTEPCHLGAVQYIVGSHEVDSNTEAVGFPIFTDNDSFGGSFTSSVNLVRGMVFLATGSRLEVLDHDEKYPLLHTANDLAKIRSYDGTDTEGTFKLVLSNSIDGAAFGSHEGRPGIKIFTASLDPSSPFYISKILNTSPDRFDETKHLLYADFAVESELAKAKHDTVLSSVAVVSGSSLFTVAGGETGIPFRDLFGNFNTRYTTARTTSFISQPYGSTEYDLFHFESLDDGAIGSQRTKISISNLRRSTNPKDPYGTFSVLVRDINDTDTNMQIIERYSNCTLNPGDDNYVGTLIGDMKAEFKFDAETDSERRLNVSGKTPNKSSYVRIIMNSNVEDGNIPESALPFGFRGLPVPKFNDSLTDSKFTSLPVGFASPRGDSRLTGSLGAPADRANPDITNPIVPPVPLRFKSTRGAVESSPGFTGHPGSLELADSRYFWGIKTDRIALTGSISNSALLQGASGGTNPLVRSFGKFLGIEKLDVLVTGSGADQFNNNKFTLARVALNNQSNATHDLTTALTTEMTGAAGDHIREAAYIRNGVLATPNYTIKDVTAAPRRLTFASLAAHTGASFFNRFTDYLKFTNIFYGGFDGLNIVDRDQRLMNDKASSIQGGGKAAGTQIAYENLHLDSSPGVGVNNNIVSSYRTAARIITDPLATRINILAIPGIRDSFVTDHVSELTKEYSKALYLMDIHAFDDNLDVVYDDATTRPNVRKTVEQFEGRAIDNNYVATYFPDIIKLDRINGDAVNMPASIAAIGALAYNDLIAYPWFAPAGFNRGALSDVINSEIRLNTEDRNILYEARINPIANFPTGPFVIFGQKTLQQAKSALDRVNVRRMLLEVKRIVSDVANRIIFEQNTPATRARFIAQVTPLLSTIQTQQGIDQFKVVMDSSNNTNLDIEQNRLNGQIILVPTRAIEFIAMDFIITNSGVSFE